MRAGRTTGWAAVLAALVLLLAAGGASAHPERPTVYPPQQGDVPKLRTTGRAHVVCTPESGRLLARIYRGTGPRTRALLAARRRTLRSCEFRHIQEAVDAARSGHRVLILPGTYREAPSRRAGHDDPRCGQLQDPGDGHGGYALYRFHLACPNARNLIFVGGDSDDDGRCDAKCDLQIQGLGRRPSDVRIVGDRVKEDVIRADRADGFVLHNVMTEQGAFNGVDVVETNGFRLDTLESAYNQNYGILSFTSDNGLYTDIEAWGNGDSGIYPGSGPERHCRSYGIEIRRVDSHDNVLGYSGTAGNGTWVHDSRFHANSAGISNDSFASGHPGMPQDCSKWERNEINSNNVNFFTKELQERCASRPFRRHPRTLVCPQFQVPVGSGFILYGVNDNIIRDNAIWDNWRSGIRLFWVPGSIRGDNAPEAQFDTSNGNRFIGNRMGVTPDGRRDLNGLDVFWDDQGRGNCWTGNTGPRGRAITSDPPALPTCPGSSFQLPPNLAKTGAEVPCAAWNPETNQRPIGCTWFDTPKEPK